MLARLFTGWTIIRAMYAIVGLWILIQSIVEHQWIVSVFGLYFAAMGLFGFGCAAGMCLPESKKAYSGPVCNNNDEIEFEEIKNNTN